LNSSFSTIKQAGIDLNPESIVAMAVYEKDINAWVYEAIESILAQTYKDFVLVIVIDGAIDSSLHERLFITAQENAKIELIHNSVNAGLSACMNYVVDQVIHRFPSVEYLFRMDSDDFAVAEKMEQQVSYLNQHDDIDILGTCLLEINEKGKVVGRRTLPRSHQKIVKLLPTRCPINHPTVAIRINVFKAGHRYRESMVNTQDYFLWVDLCAAGFKFANLPEPLIKFRRVNDFYKRRGLSKSVNEYRARRYAMKKLNAFTFVNFLHAILVLTARLLPSKMLKLLYKLDRLVMKKRFK